MNKSYNVRVQQDEDGEFFIVIPDEILEYLNILEGCTVQWTDNNDGSFTLSKVV